MTGEGGGAADDPGFTLRSWQQEWSDPGKVPRGGRGKRMSLSSLSGMDFKDDSVWKGSKAGDFQAPLILCV